MKLTKALTQIVKNTGLVNVGHGNRPFRTSPIENNGPDAVMLHLARGMIKKSFYVFTDVL